MSSTPIQIVVAAYQTPDGAGQAFKDLKEARREGWIGILDAAVLTKDEKGKLKIKDTKDMGGGKGFAIGAVVGGVIGLLAGPIGWAALGGGVLGGLAAKLSDGGFHDARLKQLGEGLTPNSSALVAVIEHVWVDKIAQALAAEGAYVVTEAIKQDIAEQLKAGGQVMFTAIASDDAATVARIAESPVAPKPETPAGDAAKK